jgi:hypothetical protein
MDFQMIYAFLKSFRAIFKYFRVLSGSGSRVGLRSEQGTVGTVVVGGVGTALGDAGWGMGWAKGIPIRTG